MNFPESDLKEIVENLGENNQKLAGKTCVVAGGSGFIGSCIKQYILYINKHILKQPCKIISIDNYAGRDKPKEIEAENLIHIEHDLTVPLGLKLINEKIDYCINASGNAAPTGPSGYESLPVETMDISYIGTRNLMELALQHKASIVHFSSSEVLALVDEYPTTEECVPKIHTQNKRACYDSMKIAIEVLGWVFKNKYNLNVKIIRLFNCIGPTMRKGDQRVVPKFMQKVLNNEKMTVFKPCTQERTFSYWTDVITGILLVMFNGKDLLYHIASDDKPVNMLDLAYKIEKVAGKSGLVEIVETPEVYKHEPQRRQASIEKARKELGFSPKVKLDEMLNRIYTYNKNINQ